MTQDQRFYVYVLFRPWNGQPCYVGKGSGERIISHRRAGERHRNQRLRNIFKKAKTLGMEVPAIIIRDQMVEDEAFRTEAAFIAAIGRKAHGGPLANLTDGGEGISGHIHSEEARQKIALAGTGAVFTEERRAKIGLSHKGMVHTAEAKAKISMAKRGKKTAPCSPEKRAKISASLKGQKFTSQRLRNMSLGQRNSDARKVLNERYRDVPLTPETRAKISAAKKGKKQTPEHRAATSASIKVWWQSRKQKSIQESEHGCTG